MQITNDRPDRSFRKLKSKRYSVSQGREVLIHAPVLRFAQNLLHSDWNGSKLKVMRLLNRNIAMLCSCRNNFSAASRPGDPSRQRQFLGNPIPIFTDCSPHFVFQHANKPCSSSHWRFSLVISHAFAELPIKLLSTNVRLKTMIEVRQRCSKMSNVAAKQFDRYWNR